MAIWRHLLRPLLPWLGKLVVAVIVLLGIAYLGGRVLIDRAEPDSGDTLPPGIPGRLIAAGGRTVHVVERGEGEPMVLVHGFAASTYDWEESLLEPLSRSHRVIALDLLGMGWSARGDDLAYGDDLWSRQIVDVLDALGLSRATLVGHSLGGAIAAIVAGEHPDRVERLVLIAPGVPMEQSERGWFFKLAEIPGVGEMMLGTADHLPQLPGFSDAYHARARAVFRRDGTRGALLRYLRHGRDTARLQASYRRIQAPTLVVYGIADDIVPYTAIRRAVPEIHDALVLPIEGAGHWLMRDEAARVLDALDHFRRDGGSASPLSTAAQARL
jgi:pimeloyl-ACP methyl ester carboxylesterase